MAVIITTADAGTLNNHILDNGILSIGNEWIIRYVKTTTNLPLNSAPERSFLGTDRACGGEGT